MNIIFVSIPIGIILLAVGVWAFFWAVRSGQYEDLDSPAYSILDDDRPRKHAVSDETAQSEQRPPKPQDRDRT